MTTNFLTNGIIGAKLDADSAGNPQDGTTPQFAVGTIATGSDGSKFMYVRSAAAITRYDTVAIDTAKDATALTPALAIAAGELGFAQVSCSTSGLYFWAMIQGEGRIRVATGCQPGVPLYTTDTAGVLDDATNTLSQHQILGLKIPAGSSNSAAAVSALPFYTGGVLVKHLQSQ